MFGELTVGRFELPELSVIKMAGLNHEFLLLSRSEHPYSDYRRWFGHSEAAQIHDDLLGYISDTLKWVVCYNPANKMAKLIGLNWYGPSIIKQDGAQLLKEVFEGWATLFANGPATLHLTGNFCWDEEQSKGQYASLTYDLNEVIETFRKLAADAKQIVNSQDDLYILHLGI
jgi:hypothetical protein